MDTTTATRSIVDALTKAIVEHRLHPGSKLAEQKLADHFGVSRTLVRQAYFHLSKKARIALSLPQVPSLRPPLGEKAAKYLEVAGCLRPERPGNFFDTLTKRKSKPLQNQSHKKRLPSNVVTLLAGPIC